MTKYVIARLVAGVLIIPAVAVAWVLFHAGLIAYGATPIGNASEVFIHGLVLGGVVELLFVLDLVWRKVDK